MNLEERARRQSRRVIITEALMVVTVIVLVSILALLVSGYWLNSDFKIERQGMLQISSLPVNATVEIDGESSWMQRTNTSKVLTSGEHTITLTKDGYDSWTKTINIREGLLYRIHYPRLFPQKREKEIVFDATAYTSASISPDRNFALLMNNTSKWELINLDSKQLTTKKIDISSIFSAVSLATDSETGLFTGAIKSLNWSNDNEHILFEVDSETGKEWVILNVKNPTDYINLTKVFATDFSNIRIINDSASSLLAVLDGDLRQIDVSNRQLSAILVEDILEFDFIDSMVVFSANKTVSTDDEAFQDTVSETNLKIDLSDPYYIGAFRIGENKIKTIATIDSTVKIATSEFYKEKYLSILNDDHLSVYKGEDLSEIFSKTLSFSPGKIKVGHFGEFIVLSSNNKIATLDMENTDLNEWNVIGASFDWLDSDMIYSVEGNKLAVYDFDGLNQRILSENVSSHFPVTITNDKWLYYFSDGQIVRETIN